MHNICYNKKFVGWDCHPTNKEISIQSQRLNYGCLSFSMRYDGDHCNEKNEQDI